MKSYIKSKLSYRLNENAKALFFDLKRLKTRLFQKKKKTSPKFKKLHIGSGAHTINGWINVDLVHSDCNLDLTHAKLPWINNSFDHIVSQHTIEHLFVEDELIPLLIELHRVLSINGEIWLSTPDMEKICKSYLNNACKDLYDDRKERMPEYTLEDFPLQHIMNDFFRQSGEHKNLFDFDFLKWTLEKAGFTIVERIKEKHLLEKFPDFLKRGDDIQTLYVKAKK
jgi:predicted SAM-dependent methyltransferase